MNAGRELDVLVAEKVCKRCGGTRRMKLKTGYTQCANCHNARTREWNRLNRRSYPYNSSAAFKRYRRKWALVNRYDMTLEEYEDLFNQQDGKCAICRQPEKINLSVDHCHATGLVRGLLCNRCNIGLSNFREQHELLTNAARYLCATK